MAPFVYMVSCHLPILYFSLTFFSSLVFYKIQYILFNGFGLRVIVGNDNTTTSDGERFAATMRFLHSCCLNLKRVGRRWGIGFDREIGLSTFTIAIGDATPHCRDRWSEKVLCSIVLLSWIHHQKYSHCKSCLAKWLEWAFQFGPVHNWKFSRTCGKKKRRHLNDCFPLFQSSFELVFLEIMLLLRLRYFLDKT